MVLVIDIGNSNIEFGVFCDNKITAKWRTTTFLSTVDELVLSLSGFLSLNSISRKEFKGCIVSSVVPLLTNRMLDMCKKFINVTPILVDVGRVKLPIFINYEYPEEVGADRIVNAVAVYREYKRGCLIIDFGTATTFCIITGDGNYLGGCITPGIQISLDALFNKAAKLSKVAFKKTERIIGTNTVTSIQSGVFYGYLFMVEGIIRKIKSETGKDLTVIATGGISGEIGSESQMIDHVDKELTLKGLKYIFDFQLVT